MKLTVISHTEHFVNDHGDIVGWGATVRELDYLTEIFDEIYHIAPLYKGSPPSGLLPYKTDKVKFIPLKPSGGINLKGKISVLTMAFHNIRVIRRTLEKCDIFQFRAPTGMGIYIIPYLMFLRHKKGWFKYAGNWVQKSPPLGYALQRLYLRSIGQRKVTINGVWAGQKNNQLTFENPCLTSHERIQGLNVLRNKKYNGILNFIFVGRLEDAKGVTRILNVLEDFIENPRIGTLHLVGDGKSRKKYEEQVKEKSLHKVVFHGFVDRDKINELLTQSHFFLLPSSASEGFPKVIAEASNYGTIPIVSDVSSIGQYIIDGETGFLVESASESILRDKIWQCLSSDESALYSIASNCYEMAGKFTYTHYNTRIKKEILNV